MLWQRLSFLIKFFNGGNPMLPGQQAPFTKIQWYLFQATLLILFLVGLIKLIRAAW
jgi:hypothetical protein